MMINVMNSVKEVEKTIDSQLWHACAGGMVQIPPLNSMVFYFPQGHAEHAASENINFGDSSRIPAYILCRVSATKYLAEPDTDEVYAKLSLTPLKNHNGLDSYNDGGLGFDLNKNQNHKNHKNQKNQENQENEENPTSFAKTLTQSDANNGGGFSVPRYCADTIFPKLDYTADPPVQTISAKDVLGKIWKFRHIYRGTPRRHLLTTGWSNFVNKKKLVAGDSVMFLKSDNGDLCVGVRRAKRGLKDDHKSMFLKNHKGKFSCESVIEAVNRAANGDPFEVLYYPRAGDLEFCVKASTAMAAMRIQWCPGMRFKMPFETEDSSRISWFMGTVSSVNVNDQTRWPNSPWKLLEVSWDEPDLLQNVKRVNPWLVEPVSNMPPIHLSPFSPPRKKTRIPQPPDFPLISSLFPTNNTPESIQGARHTITTDITKKPEENEKLSCFLTLGSLKNSTDVNDDNEKNRKKPVFMLFGQPILTEQQLSESWSGDGSVVLQNGQVESSSDEAGPWLPEQKSESGLENSRTGGTV